MNAYKWYLPFVCAAVCSSCIFGADNAKRSSPTGGLWFQKKLTHNGRDLSPRDLKTIASLGNETHFKDVLEPIMTPRVVGTPQHAAVRKHLVEQMQSVGWTIEEDSFDDSTPVGMKTFTNIVATLDPAIPRRLVLACHYDSKLTPDGFVGATDSAVPCAMLINLARTLKSHLDAYNVLNNDLTLQFMFLDGEESFVKWTATDSLYGARNLAHKLHQTSFPPGNVHSISHLDRIDLFVLLDLIGTEDCSFFSLFKDSDRWFNKFSSYERRMRDSGLLNLRPFLFKDRKLYGASIEDDHIPFLHRGVPILHLISVPFPTVWHKISDNGQAIHFPTIQDMNSLMRVFVVDYLSLSL